MKKANSDFDIVIVGGGIAGIYTAWRLIMVDKSDSSKLKKWKKKSKLRIALYEGSDRIGGRLMSATPPGFNSVMNCEYVFDTFEFQIMNDKITDVGERRIFSGFSHF